MKRLLKKMLPKKVLNLKHLFYAWLGNKKYNSPSDEMLVIGITGTSGKSTVIALLRQLLEHVGYTVGSLSTIDFYVAGTRHMNDKKMTMLGKMQTHQYLRQMADAGCDIAIVESTSEGRVQHRHRFINFDMMVLTNLHPEHIESHGSFEAYKQAKLDLFAYTASCKHKILKGKNISKIGISNSLDGHAPAFLGYDFDERFAFGPGSPLEASNISMNEKGIHFNVEKEKFHVNMFGEYNVQNVLCTITIAKALGIGWSDIHKAVQTFTNIEGRIEFISEAEQYGIKVIVDYAFLPVAIQELYKVVDLVPHKRLIHVCGSTGGGRDKGRRVPIGRLVGEKADLFYVTDEDPYDEDPLEIMDAVSRGAQSVGKQLGKDLFEMTDREEAIKTAVCAAQPGDLVVITGKGSEQAMCLANGKMIPWDDRQIARDALKLRSTSSNE